LGKNLRWPEQHICDIVGTSLSRPQGDPIREAGQGRPLKATDRTVTPRTFRAFKNSASYSSSIRATPLLGENCPISGRKCGKTLAFAWDIFCKLSENGSICWINMRLQRFLSIRGDRKLRTNRLQYSKKTTTQTLKIQQNTTIQDAAGRCPRLPGRAPIAVKIQATAQIPGLARSNKRASPTSQKSHTA